MPGLLARGDGSQWRDLRQPSLSALQRFFGLGAFLLVASLSIEGELTLCADVLSEDRLNASPETLTHSRCDAATTLQPAVLQDILQHQPYMRLQSLGKVLFSRHMLTGCSFWSDMVKCCSTTP